jgi:hypothetical protein
MDDDGVSGWLCQPCSTANGGGRASDTAWHFGVCDACGDETAVAPLHEYGGVRYESEDEDA